MNIRILVSLFLLIFHSVCAGFSQGMENTNVDEPLPIDPHVRYGKLANGFTYYIRHSAAEPNKVMLNLVVKAGVMQEDKDQAGLSHLLEHMAFRGTTNFPEGFYAYSNQFGLKRGRDINASTEMHSTSYRISLPSDNEKLFEGALQCLRDWCGEFLLRPADIETERGAVIAEMRRGNDSIARDFSPRLLADSEYGLKTVKAATELNVKTFHHPSLMRFYHDWYRPDLEAAIIVGDINPDTIEQQVIALFGDLKAHDKPRPIMHYEAFVPGEMNFITSTSGVREPSIHLYTKMPGGIRKTANDYRRSLIAALYNVMITKRLNALQNQYNAPVSFATSRLRENEIDGGVLQGGVIGLNVLSTVIRTGSPEFLKPGFMLVFSELTRLRQHGFTARELVEAKENVLKNEQSGEFARLRTLVQSYKDHFVHGQAAMETGAERRLKENLIANSTLQEVNRAVREWLHYPISDIVIQGPHDAGRFLPEKKTVLEWIQNIHGMKFQPFQPKEDVITLASLDQIRVDTPAYSMLDREGEITELNFANGLRIVLKQNPRNSMSGKWALHGFTNKGSRFYHGRDYPSAMNAAKIVRHSGVAGVNKFSLERYSEHAGISVIPYVTYEWSGITGRASQESFETMLQVVREYFVSPVRDEAAFRDWKFRQIQEARNRDPEQAFLDSIREATGAGRLLNSAGDLERTDFKRAHDIYKQIFSDASKFTFILTGDFDRAEVAPLIARYLGTLPAADEYIRANSLPVLNGTITRERSKVNCYYIGTEASEVDVQLLFTGPFDFNAENTVKLDVISALLKPMLTNALRKDVYSVTVNATYQKHSTGEYAFAITFTCALGSENRLIDKAKEIIASLSHQDIDSALAGIVSAGRRDRNFGFRSNFFWSDYLSKQYQNGADPGAISHRPGYLERLTPDTIKDAVKQYLNEDAFIQFMMMPVKQDAGQD